MRHPTRWFPVVLLGIAALVLSGCQIPPGPLPGATPTAQGSLATMVAGTLTAMQSTAPPPANPTPGVPSPPPTPTAAPTPATPGPIGSAHYLWAYQEDGHTLTLYSAAGEAVTSLSLPDIESGIQVHAATPVDFAHPETLQLVYAAHHQENKEVIITINTYANGQPHTELEVGSTQHSTLINMVGIPAAGRIAYSVLTMIGYDYHSALYVHSLGSSPPTQSLYETTTSDGRIVYPLSIGADGVWFTYAYFGAPMGPVGLYHIGYQGDLLEALPQTYRLLGFDAATGWVAYTAKGTGGGNGPASLTWRPLEIGDLTAPSPQAVTMQDPVSLPDAWPVTATLSEAYIAWSVHVGSPMEGDEFLRVYTLDGQMVSVEPPTASSIIFPQTSYTLPQTWLRQQYLVLQGRDVNTQQDILILTPPNLDPDASLTLPGVYLGRAWAGTP